MVKNLPANGGDVGSIPGSERSPGEGNGSPFQYSCLENSMDRGTWQATVHGGIHSPARPPVLQGLAHPPSVHTVSANESRAPAPFPVSLPCCSSLVERMPSPRCLSKSSSFSRRPRATASVTKVRLCPRVACHASLSPT